MRGMMLLLPLALACAPARDPSPMSPIATIQNCGEVGRGGVEAAQCLLSAVGCGDAWAMATTRPGERLASNGCAVVRVRAEGHYEVCAGLRELGAWPYVEEEGCLASQRGDLDPVDAVP